METNNDNKESNDDTCHGFYQYGNCPDHVDACWYYFVNSNNGENPDDELNYQTSKHNMMENQSFCTSDYA